MIRCMLTSPRIFAPVVSHTAIPHTLLLVSEAELQSTRTVCGCLAADLELGAEIN